MSQMHDSCLELATITDIIMLMWQWLRNKNQIHLVKKYVFWILIMTSYQHDSSIKNTITTKGGSHQ